MTMRTEAFIDGRFVPAADGRTFATVSPRDGSEIAQVARGGAEDIDRAVRAARRAFEREDWAYADPAQRGRVLVRLAELMTEHLDELARLEDGEEAGEALGRHDDVDKIAFTGSVPVGRLFQRYAGESNGKAVSLELGGKSPQVVLADAGDLQAAAQAIGWGIFYNAGQTCHAGSRVVVARPVRDELVERLERYAAETFLPADPMAPDTVLGALISTEHLDGVMGRVQRAADGGARVLTGGERAEPVPGGAYMQPTLIETDDRRDPIVTEEVFGPVLVIQTADDVDHALELANDTRYGLAAALWTSDLRTAGRLARRLRAGTVWVNTFDASSMATPFGGFRDSGHGRDRSLHALEAYTQLKTTWISLT
jgi:gamma-glutamyl-gamma-aminobutyraldehyde dehydrogenase/4-guanidinobutyraldehyde dehydrogenase/NAD-dependent aldehyde dehydrogenase